MQNLIILAILWLIPTLLLLFGTAYRTKLMISAVLILTGFTVHLGRIIYERYWNSICMLKHYSATEAIQSWVHGRCVKYHWSMMISHGDWINRRIADNLELFRAVAKISTVEYSIWDIISITLSIILILVIFYFNI